MSVNPAPRAYQVVLTAIENDLRSGVLTLGDQLPGERALAEQHGISRASVRDAIRIVFPEAVTLVREAREGLT